MMLSRTHSLCASIHNEMSCTACGRHRATSETTLLPAARCFATATPPHGGRSSVPVAGFRGFMVGGWLFCLLVVFLIVLVIVTRGFVGLLSWMQRQGILQSANAFLADSVQGLHENVFFSEIIVANSDF